MLRTLSGEAKNLARGPQVQGWMGYAGTHVPMFVPRLVFVNEARTKTGLSLTMGFLNENDSLM